MNPSLKILYTADWHLMLRTPTHRKDDLGETSLKKVEEVFSIATSHKVDYILHGGDLFNAFDPPLSLLYQLIKLFKSSDIPFLVVLGNHDIHGSNIMTYRRAGVGILKQAQVVEILKDDQLRQLFEPVPIVDGDTSGIYLKGIHYRTDPDLKDYEVDPTKRVIICSHDMIVPTPVPYNYIAPSAIRTTAKLILCSHYHLPFKFECNDTLYVNPGSLLRLSATPGDINRLPQVALIEMDDKSLSVDFIPLSCAKKGDEVFDVDKVQQRKDRAVELDEFIRNLSHTEFSQLELKSLIAKVGEEEKIDNTIVQEALTRIRSAEQSLED